MNFLKKILKGILMVICIPIVYVVLALICTYIPVSESTETETKNHTLYLRTNGVHIDFIVPIDEITPTLLQDLDYSADDQYFAFGWGDKKFYLETPEWKDLTLWNALTGIFLITPSLMHVSRLQGMGNNWVCIKLTSTQNEKLQAYIAATFKLNGDNRKVILPDEGYHNYDAFYEANGSFTGFKTCNSWANTGLRESGMKACLWTPFDFGILMIYQ